MSARWFDTHCHLVWREEENPPGPQLERAREAGVAGFVCVATDSESARRCRALAEGEPQVLASAGIHPNDVGDAEGLGARLEELDALLEEGGFAAVGETGLDFYRDWSEPAVQEESLLHHLEQARARDLPVILHCRAAADRLRAVLRDFGPLRGVMHCYSEGPDPLDDFLAAGLHVSFAGNMTYPKSEPLREAARRVPLDRLLVETDAPFLAPVPRRGKRNEPAYVAHTAAYLAELRGVEPGDLGTLTTRNACELFGLELPTPA